VLLYGAYITFLPLYMAERFGSSPLVIGAIMTSISVVTAVTSARLGRLARRFGEPRLLRVGFAAAALGLLVIPAMPITVALLLPAALLGFGFAVTIPVVITLLAGYAPDDRRAVFMSLNGTVLRLGQTLGPVVMTAVFAIGGFAAVYVAGAAIGLGLAGLMAVFIRGRGAAVEEPPRDLGV
jgi:MFS family permease